MARRYLLVAAGDPRDPNTTSIGENPGVTRAEAIESAISHFRYQRDEAERFLRAAEAGELRVFRAEGYRVGKEVLPE